ncbi:hypothetical protein BKA65DRAFT_557482 [Rhexocercosporidium sp. MPI-PUGE-AT-0058]|nr:hypothetical protein BKA65DRAFT_557482 [Rhexocercosporidium sp. MPI-PUGE-AT-0058]
MSDSDKGRARSQGRRLQVDGDADVTVDLLPNREVYEDMYPSDSEDEDDSEEEDLDAEVEEMKSINDRIKKLNVRLPGEQEKINSAANRLKVYRDHDVATGAVEGIREEIRKTEKEKEKMKLAKALVKANKKVEKEKATEREKRLRRKAEIAKEKQRSRESERRGSRSSGRMFPVPSTLMECSSTRGEGRR